jgi:hypothetical protein
MPSRCQGFSRRVRSEALEQCPYDAESSALYCYLHGKVVAGLVAPISWTPHRDREGKLVSAPLERLLIEWDV